MRVREESHSLFNKAVSVLSEKLSMREAVSSKSKSLREKRAKKSEVIEKKYFIIVSSFCFNSLML